MRFPIIRWDGFEYWKSWHFSVQKTPKYAGPGYVRFVLADIGPFHVAWRIS